ncbi:hypothetical protein BV360_05396 [Pseudomonas syringae pv. actinidiae]|nr:hypothetical protein BV340_05318 [Pseudomonas syringae pv. actinidiae]OSN14645.1 hypothetical protein BV341_05432 [Pseudomonas syringae pv. actinidiae]OSN29529.1 hypothetical protein BV342_05457 [Pseudomonas syringae pv. actinidiae]OSN50163.1 hypothetical protein BV347_05405 [Pseudomonas syringae pv. actinidiae]OSN63957.1 hypothetical protein BV350_05365 [Pseudomonas syringae pv. actinidiae]
MTCSPLRKFFDPNTRVKKQHYVLGSKLILIGKRIQATQKIKSLNYFRVINEWHDSRTLIRKSIIYFKKLNQLVHGALTLCNTNYQAQKLSHAWDRAFFDTFF